MTPVFDHLAVAAETLDAGVAAVEEALGLRLQPGGKHAAMGTPNRLIGMGPGEYLEVIAIDPEAPGPGASRTTWPRRSRWIASGGRPGRAPGSCAIRRWKTPWPMRRRGPARRWPFGVTR